MPFLILAYAAIVYAMFLATFLYTIGFVANLPLLPRTIDSGLVDGTFAALAVNVLLLGVFAVQHSVMARQGFKRWWTRIVPPPAERSTYVLAATAAIALLMWQWRAMPDAVWDVQSRGAQVAIWAVFALGWATLLAATFLINHFELFGLNQAWNAFRARPFTAPPFRTPGLYRMVRHPIYLGFILAFWATPHMSQGHLLFAVATTAYILIGIWFEERDLVAHFGERYLAYRKRVPMLVPRLPVDDEANPVRQPTGR
jgi:methanethiol S-methyltransferase